MRSRHAIKSEAAAYCTSESCPGEGRLAQGARLEQRLLFKRVHLPCFHNEDLMLPYHHIVTPPARSTQSSSARCSNASRTGML